MGVVGYRMITGQLPFGGDSVHTILYKHIFEPAPRTSSIRQDMPPHLSESISRALAKEPDQRYATMEEFATAVWPEQPVSAPTKGGKAASTSRRPPPRTKGPVTADTPTEVTNAPTTPIPRAGMKVGGAAPKKSRMGLFVGVAVVAVAGVGGYLALANKQGAAPPPVSPPPQTTRAPVETVRVATPTPTPPPATPTPRRQTPPPRQTTPPPAQAAQGFITVNSDPPGTVFIDNREVGSTPVVEFDVPAGRHTIRVERPGFKTKSETVDVGANATVRKRWVLDPEGSD